MRVTETETNFDREGARLALEALTWNAFGVWLDVTRRVLEYANLTEQLARLSAFTLALKRLRIITTCHATQARGGVASFILTCCTSGPLQPELCLKSILLVRTPSTNIKRRHSDNTSPKHPSGSPSAIPAWLPPSDQDQGSMNCRRNWCRASWSSWTATPVSPSD